jgi:hypothetical protein
MAFVVKNSESPNCRTHFLQVLKKGRLGVLRLVGILIAQETIYWPQ